jgi:hypothetical protein
MPGPLNEDFLLCKGELLLVLVRSGMRLCSLLESPFKGGPVDTIKLDHTAVGEFGVAVQMVARGMHRLNSQAVTLFNGSVLEFLNERNWWRV